MRNTLFLALVLINLTFGVSLAAQNDNQLNLISLALRQPVMASDTTLGSLLPVEHNYVIFMQSFFTALRANNYSRFLAPATAAVLADYLNRNRAAFNPNGLVFGLTAEGEQIRLLFKRPEQDSYGEVILINDNNQLLIEAISFG
ncbi:MAG: hypothetical protein FWE37_09015 [Spirochaetaceae bacterium]|nr:hypothetical protein [Spirochaetaceae bacterium]